MALYGFDGTWNENHDVDDRGTNAASGLASR